MHHDRLCYYRYILVTYLMFTLGIYRIIHRRITGFLVVPRSPHVCMRMSIAYLKPLVIDCVVLLRDIMFPSAFLPLR